MQVFGSEPGEFRAATAGFGRDGDRAGWEAFLADLFGSGGSMPRISNTTSTKEGPCNA
jgi:hypothetical protein